MTRLFCSSEITASLLGLLENKQGNRSDLELRKPSYIVFSVLLQRLKWCHHMTTDNGVENLSFPTPPLTDNWAEQLYILHVWNWLYVYDPAGSGHVPQSVSQILKNSAVLVTRTEISWCCVALNCRGEEWSCRPDLETVLHCFNAHMDVTYRPRTRFLFCYSVSD